MSRYVLTGGPGVGKTTLIDTLKQEGHHVVEEAAWQIIVEEQLEFVDTVGWEGAAAFQEKIAARQLLLEARAPSDEFIFLDRGLIDGVAYCNIEGISVPKLITDHATNRYAGVFLLDFLPEYTTGPGRQDSLETAKRIHEEIARAYIEYGYSPIPVPALDQKARCAFVLEQVRLIQNAE